MNRKIFKETFNILMEDKLFTKTIIRPDKSTWNKLNVLDIAVKTAKKMKKPKHFW